MSQSLPDDSLYDESSAESSLSQILVCRKAKYGCHGAWSYELGKEATAQRIRDDHEQNRCLYRHLPI